MYAKLRFQSTATAAERNLSIVKAITDCYDAPASITDFSGYLGLDSANTEFYSTDSSHWTFAGAGGGQSLGTTSLDYQADQNYYGMEYTLKCTYDTGHTQYTDIKVMGNITHSNMYNGEEAPTMIVPRNRFGTSLENRQLGNHTVTTPTDQDLRGQGVSHVKNPEIHVFADQTKLALVGSSMFQSDQHVFNSLWNFNRPGHMKYQDTVKPISDSNVPCVWLLVGTGKSAVGHTFTEQNTSGWSGDWDNNSEHGPVVCFPGNIYNHRTNTKFRNVGFSTSISTSSNLMNTYSERIDDDVTQEPTTSGNGFDHYAQTADQTGYDVGFGYRACDWGSDKGENRWYGNANSVDANASNAAFGMGHIFDSNGNKQIPVYPILQDWHPFGGELVNMSQKSGIYHSIGAAGFWGDSADIGGTKYQYFPFSANHSWVIKRD